MSREFINRRQTRSLSCEILETIPKGVEVAIGGGNPLFCPQVNEFWFWMKMGFIKMVDSLLVFSVIKKENYAFL